jgi:uncharacterized protein (DUF2147 family)
MKRLLALAAFLLASSAAQAQYTFEYGGRTIHIDPDHGTVSIPGVYDNTPRKAKRSHNNTDQDSAHKSQPQVPQEAKVEPQAPADAATPPAPQTAAPAAAAPAPAAPAATVPTATANTAPASSEILAPPASPAPAQQQDSGPKSAPAPSVAAVPPPAVPQLIPAPAPPQAAAAAPAQATAQAPAAARDPNSPIGVWLTEEKEGKVRIEQCGSNLCGYSVDTKSNQNGEQVLINMKPGRDQKWSGRILDPNTGSTYDSTIALKGADTLRVQGCAFGGMFCGGQIWTRVN